MIQLAPPFTEENIRALRVADLAQITGRLYTGRDAVHKRLYEGGPLPASLDLRQGILYHCGPVVIQNEAGQWIATAAGPTTSSREEPYQAKLIEKFKLRGIIGKGGMGDRTLAACQEFGCVYFHAIGGAAQVLAQCIKKVHGVHFLKEFGAPEAIWEFEVENFPVVVTMDSHGQSLHKEILARSQAALAKLIA